MTPASTVLQISIRLKGVPVSGATDRQERIEVFDQVRFSAAHILCIGAGGLISHIAPTLVRKGIGRLTLLDGDIVERSNLNRQRFYDKDIGRNKAIQLAQNLQPECIVATEIIGYAYRFEEAVARSVDLTCEVAVCGVDNNVARVAVSRHFRSLGVPVIFTAVSRDADHGYVFVQEGDGACIGCLFPDMAGDDRYPCPGTPAIADILQAVGAFAAYAVDTLVAGRSRAWNYRRVFLHNGIFDGQATVTASRRCRVHTQLLT